MDVQMLALRSHVTGSRATLKAIGKNQAEAVFVAMDADTRLIMPVKEACARHDVPLKEIATMRELGRAARLDVAAAAAAILRS